MIVLYTSIKKERHAALMHKYLNSNPQEFKNKILKYRKWQDAQLALLGRVLLKLGLNKFYGITAYEIALSEYHKPFLKNLNIHFNISHAGSIVVCTIADFPIGIDVEWLDQEINYLDFRAQMTDNEFNTIQNSDNRIGDFLNYWTTKEAVIKAVGKGLMIPLNSFEISQNSCIIGHEIFYLNEIFINESYKCSVSSNDNRITKNEFHIDHVNLYDL